MPVSAAKQDVMRTAVAVDGQKRVWVIWSANKNGNFDIYREVPAGGKWSQEMRLTNDPGTDVNPVAATDSQRPRLDRMAGLPQSQSRDPGRGAGRR